MTCLLTKGFTLPCDVPAGIKKLYFMNYSEIDAITKTSGEVTGITLAVGKKAFIYEVAPEVTNFSEKSIGTKENGSYAFEQTFSTMITSNPTTTVSEMEILQSARVVVIAVNNDGKNELFFEDFGAKMTVERVNEAKFDGFNGYKLSTTHRQVNKACLVSDEALAAIPIV